MTGLGTIDLEASENVIIFLEAVGRQLIIPEPSFRKH